MVAKPRRHLLLIAFMLFVLEFIGIIGYYWLFGGHEGDTTLTISRYVGLNPLSCAAFCACNFVVAVLIVWHLATHEKLHGMGWRFLIYAFVVSFLALSVSPHLPEGGMSTDIHLFFAGSMFTIMALTGLFDIIATKRKSTLIVALLFLVYAVFFIICDLFRVSWFMDNILIYESAYIFAYFVLLLV